MRQPGVRYERLNMLLLAFYGGGALFGARLLHMQVIRNVYYARVAESNRTQIIHQAAPRGRIYDRNGRVIATSRPTFSLIYLPGAEKAPEYLERLAGSLANELHRKKEHLLALLRQAQRMESAIHLAENLQLKPMFRLSELKTLYPGVDLVVEARRYYPEGAHGGHLLGYMGKMDKRSWRKLKSKDYRIDSWIGRSGLEKHFENVLRGVDGETRMEINAQGSLKRKIGEVPWKQGSNLTLALDSRIQKAVEEALRLSPSGMGGAVVLDPRSGAILAMASIPDYDPNLFLLPDWDEAKTALKDFPEFNRAISGTYAPGSTFKIIVGAAMLEEGKVSPQDTVFCPGSFSLGGRTFRCWEKKGHRRMDWIAGLTNSCDVYFYKSGLRTGGALIEEYSRRFHLGQKTGVILSGENAGNLFGPQARRERKRSWYDGDTVNLSIGQGELLATPVQMAVVMSAVANKGTLWRPHLTQRIESSDGRVLYQQKPQELGRVELKPETWKLLHQGLISVVKNGTGRRVDIPGLVVGGKTGTSQNPRGEDHAWFVAFAGREGEEPEIAVSVLVEHGGHGSSAAGPVARKAIEAAFDIASEKPAALAPAAAPVHPAVSAPPVGRPQRPPPAADADAELEELEEALFPEADL
ncbi:MAG: penicillin-binding protein 2 [Elusimicrobiota bacterium]